jgi:hypothetical protein
MVFMKNATTFLALVFVLSNAAAAAFACEGAQVPVYPGGQCSDVIALPAPLNKTLINVNKTSDGSFALTAMDSGSKRIYRLAATDEGRLVPVEELSASTALFCLPSEIFSIEQVLMDGKVIGVVGVPSESCQ